MSNNDNATDSQELPVLRPVEGASDEISNTTMSNADLAALETALASRMRDLADTLLHNAMVEMEAALFERVSNQLRAQLPQLVHQILSEHVNTEDAP